MVMHSRIAIHGVPRSGTTWVGEIFNSSEKTIYKFQPLFSYAFKDFLSAASSRQDIDEFYSQLATSRDDFLDQTEARQRGDIPIFNKTVATHVVYKEVRYHQILFNLARKGANVRLILVIRNPLSVISSWLRAPREFRADLGWTPEEEWRYALKKNLNRVEEFNGYERWKDAARMFLQIVAQFPDQATLVEYRRLIESPEAEVERLFSICGLEIGQQSRQFLAMSQSHTKVNPYSVFRSDQDDDKWKDNLDPTIASAIIDDLRGTELERFLYLD